MSDRLKQLSEAGVSIWLDDLSRERLETGNLADLEKNSSVVGVTTNPSIFAKALEEGERYDDQVRELADQGADLDAVFEELTTTDVRNACDVFMDVFEASDGVDGRVSIEVYPGIAHDTEQTVRQAEELWRKVDRPNLLHQDPRHPGGLAGHHRDARRRDQRQRHPDLRPRPVPARDGGLRRRAREGPGRRPRPLQAALGGVVLRLPSRHRDRQAARGHGRAGRPARQGRGRQRPARLRGLRGVLRRRPLAGSRRCGREPATAAVGVDRRQEPRLRRHHVRRRPGGAETP